MSEELANFTSALAKDVIAKAGPELIAYLESRRVQPKEDPLLNVKEVAAQLRLGETTIRLLVGQGHLQRAPGISDIRIRQSVVDAYGKAQPPKSGKGSK